MHLIRRKGAGDKKGSEERVGEPLGNYCERLWTLLVKDVQTKLRWHNNFPGLCGKHHFPQFVDCSGEQPHPSCQPQLPHQQHFLSSFMVNLLSLLFPLEHNRNADEPELNGIGCSGAETDVCYFIYAKGNKYRQQGHYLVRD